MSLLASTYPPALHPASAFARITDETLTFWLVVVALVVGSFLIWLLFRSSYSRPPDATKRILVDAIKNQRLSDLQEELRPLEAKLRVGRASLQQLTLDFVAAQEGKLTEQELKSRQEGIETEKRLVDELETKLNAERARLEVVAHNHAKSLVNEALPAVFDLSAPGRGSLFLEFATVVIIIVSVLILAFIQVLDGEQVAPILASIAGYVLGRSTSELDRKSEPQ
ncbi:MAG TPA: hypothetical protein VF707_06445 [Ardenticatenaceae bacterium]|jgi:hypothetical protein